jgi:hypothetical protein
MLKTKVLRKRAAGHSFLVRPDKMEGLDATFLPVVEQSDAVMREF